jgi:signal transduction histidine kinase
MIARWLGRLSIGKKLALSFSLILILLVGSLIASLFYLARVNSYVERHQRITIPGVITASEMLRSVADLQTHMHDYLEHPEHARRNSALAMMAHIEHRTLTALDTYQTTHAARTHPVLYGMLQAHGQGELAEQETRTIVAIADGLSALRAQREDLIGVVPRSTPRLSALESAYDLHRRIDGEMKIEGDRLVEQARLLIMAIVGMLAILIVSISVMMQRLVARPLQQLAATADRVAHHDLTAQFATWPTRDEVGTLAASLATMLANLRERRMALMRKTKELEAFTYSVAHDLKGPLREIEGFSSLLEKRFADSGDPQLQHQIDVIRRSALRLTHMIDALLKYSRLEQQDLPKQRFNLMEMVGSLVMERVAHVVGPKPTIHVDLPFADLYGEPVSIRQAMANLLDNAAKFSRPETMNDIRVGGRTTDRERIIWVKDTGIGFDAEQSGRIFGLFERLHGPGDYDGTGVGLAIVQMVMDKQGGRAWAESKPGHGSTFFLSFPHAEDAPGGQRANKPAR